MYNCSLTFREWTVKNFYFQNYSWEGFSTVSESYSQLLRHLSFKRLIYLIVLSCCLNKMIFKNRSYHDRSELSTVFNLKASECKYFGLKPGTKMVDLRTIGAAGRCCWSEYDQSGSDKSRYDDATPSTTTEHGACRGITN